jgi:hypothetical protein
LPQWRRPVLCSSWIFFVFALWILKRPNRCRNTWVVHWTLVSFPLQCTIGQCTCTVHA